MQTDSTPEDNSISTLARDRADYDRAIAILKDGDEAGGQAMLIAQAEKGSTCWEVYHDLGALALAGGDIDAAHSLLSHSVSLESEPGRARRGLALVQSIQKDYEAALATLSPALRQDTDNHDLLGLVREILGAAPMLSPVAWARLLGDLRSLPPRLRTLLDDAESANDRARNLQLENDRLKRQILDLHRDLQASAADGHADRWETIHALEDDAWLQVLIRSIELPFYKGFPLPTFPDERLQLGTVGSSNANALQEGFNFFRAVKTLSEKHGHPLTPTTRLIDFGTGWGRYARLFVKEVRPEHILGLDVDPSFVEVCRNTFPYGRFETVPAFPPSGQPAGSFDLIIAYSVFSHLSEAAATAWIEEFAQLLAPGGIIAITTQGRSFLQFCENIRQTNQLDTPWHRNLARSFIDRADCERRYDEGEFLYSATGAAEIRPASFYGEALIPRQYVERNWIAKGFELLEFIDDRGFLPQALIMLRKV